METTTAQKVNTDVRRAVVTNCFSDIFYQFGGMDYQFGDSNYQFGINSAEEIIFSVSIRINEPSIR